MNEKRVTAMGNRASYRLMFSLSKKYVERRGWMKRLVRVV